MNTADQYPHVIEKKKSLNSLDLAAPKISELSDVTDLRMGRDGVSTAFSLQKTMSSLYSGGGAEWRDGQLYTMDGGAVNVVVEGEVVGRRRIPSPPSQWREWREASLPRPRAPPPATGPGW